MYDVGVASNDIMVMPNLMKIDQLIKNLKEDKLPELN
jgi:hypothetical protein